MRTHTATLIGLFFSLCNILAAHAEDDEPNLFFQGDKEALFWFDDTFSIKVLDGVEGGCLPQPDNLKTKMEVSLRQAGFAIADEPSLLLPEVIIYPFGYAIDGGCSVVITTEIRKYVIATVPFSHDYGADGNLGNTLVLVRHTVSDNMLTGSKSGMQRRLEDMVRDHGDQIYLFIARSKDFMRSKFPKIIQRHEAL